MINGRVERCADNIMRRIVPVRETHEDQARSPGTSALEKFRPATENRVSTSTFFPGTGSF